MKFIWNIFVFLPLLLACSRERPQAALSVSNPSDSNVSSFYVEDTIEDENLMDTAYLRKHCADLSEEDLALLFVMAKMEKNENLNSGDFQTICTSLFRQVDFSEGFGGGLFDYLQRNVSHNEEFLNYLHGKTSPYKDSVLSEMVIMMFIDLEEENYYSYKEFVKDFPLFKGNAAAKRSFEKCWQNCIKS